MVAAFSTHDKDKIAQSSYSVLEMQLLSGYLSMLGQKISEANNPEELAAYGERLDRFNAVRDGLKKSFKRVYPWLSV